MTGASLKATIYPYSLDTHYRFEYGTTAGYGTSVPVPDGDAGSSAGTVQVSQSITGLTPNTTYHFRIVASNSEGPATGETGDKTFTTTGTTGTPPSVVVDAASPTAEGFSLSGTVNPNGSDTRYHFEYGTTTGYGTQLPAEEVDVGSGTTPASVSEEVKNAVLLSSTTYHFRLVAHNSGGSVPSSDQTFTTAPAPGPSAVAKSPIPIPGGVELEGEINPNSLETKYHFEYGTTTGYGKDIPAQDAPVGEGTSPVAVSQSLTGLSPNTVYHYRVVAHNSEGTALSQDQIFTSPPNSPVVTATPFSEAGGVYSLNGTVNPNGGDTTYHFEFGITTAYGISVPGTDADAGSGTSVVSISQSVGSLPPSVPYHYRLVARNAGGTTISNDQEFVTPPASVVVPEVPQLLPPSPAPAGNPPAPPTNQFTVKPAVAKGTGATLQVSVPGPGTVSASGKELKTATAGSSGAGTVTLKLKLSGAGLKALNASRSHKLSVKVSVVFAPAGGSPGSTIRTVTFKKQ